MISFQLQDQQTKEQEQMKILEQQRQKLAEAARDAAAAANAASRAAAALPGVKPNTNQVSRRQILTFLDLT